MTLIDSIDSVLMLYSYTGFPEQRFRLFEPAQENEHPEQESSAYREAAATRGSAVQLPPRSQSGGQNDERRHSPTEVPPTLVQPSGQGAPPEGEPAKVLAEDGDALVSDIRKKARKELIVKRNMMSGLSIVLTLMSIIVAFSISLITIMGLIGDRCARCTAAAENDEGLAGGWWRFWAAANDNSGYIGAGIVGSFVLVVAGWYGVRRALSKWKRGGRRRT